MTGLDLIALGLYAALCFHLMLPFETGVPGFSTFTVLKLFALALVLASIPRWRSPDFGRAVGRAAVPLSPFLLLALWLLAVSLAHPVYRWLDLKLLLGFAVGAYACLVLAVLAGREEFRRAAVTVVLAGGVIALAGGLLEPLTTPAWDGFWRLFRPYVAAWDPVRGRAMALGGIHQIEEGQFRVAGFFSNCNQLANFLVVWFPLVAARLATAGRTRWPVWAGLAAAALVFAHTLTRSSVLAAAGGCVAVVGLGTILRHGWQAWRSVAAAGLLVLAVAVTGPMTPLRVSAAGIAALLALAWANRRETRGARGNAPSGAPTAVALRRFAVVGILILAAVPVTAWFQPVTGGRLGETGTSAVSWRRAVWSIAATQIRNAPLLGPGYHAFYAELVRYPGLAGGGGVSDPHNIYLTAAVAGGIPAAGLLILGFLVLVRTAWVRSCGRVAGHGSSLALAWAWYWLAYIPLGLVGQEIFRVNGAVFFFALAALTVAGPGFPARRAGRRR